jgi:hypothetical protein
MKKNSNKTRVLALDLRMQRFGFAVFEGVQHLLEWGVRTYPTADVRELSKTVAKRISPLLTLFDPSVVVIKRALGSIGPEHSRGATILRTITHEARQHSIAWSFVEREEIRRTFGVPVRTKKHQIAARVSLCFPELTWKLPPERKCYKSEHPGMAVFDAISVGLTYLARSEQIHTDDHRRLNHKTPDR